MREKADRVWLSTVGCVVEARFIPCEPSDPPMVVKHFQLGSDQLMLSDWLSSAFDERQGVADWLAFNQQGANGVLYLDRRGQGRFRMVDALILQDFYALNPEFTDLSADDLFALGGIETHPTNPTE